MYVRRFVSFDRRVNHNLGVAVRLVRFGKALFKLSRRAMGISVWVEGVSNFWLVVRGPGWVCGCVGSRCESPP